MKLVTAFSALFSATGVVATITTSGYNQIKLYPRCGQENVNPDAQLSITFPSPPAIGPNGTIRVYDAADKKLIDTLNL